MGTLIGSRSKRVQADISALAAGKGRVEYTGCGRVPSVLRFGLIFRPERRLNGTHSVVLDIGHYPGPVLNAAFSPRELPLRILELAFGVAHTPALDWIELSVNGHRDSQLPTQFITGRAAACRLLRSPEYRLRDLSFLTANPRAFFCPTTTRNFLARVIPV